MHFHSFNTNKWQKPEYGLPEPATTNEVADTTTTEVPTTTEVSTAENETENLSEKLKEGGQGSYYVFHPSGLLQKVIFTTKDDFENMAYYAVIKYEDVEPINGPIYTYDPETAELRRIARKVQKLTNVLKNQNLFCIFVVSVVLITLFIYYENIKIEE